MLYLSHSRASLVFNQLMPVLTHRQCHACLGPHAGSLLPPFVHLSGLGNPDRASQRPGERLGAGTAAFWAGTFLCTHASLSLVA